MYKKKQFSAIGLVESFRSNSIDHMSKDDVEFCNKLISYNLNEHQMDDHISDYIVMKGRKKRLDIQEAEHLACHISDYITVRCGLILSYFPSMDNISDIPERFYKPAPKGIGMMLVAIPKLGIVIKTSTSPGDAWYGEQRSKSGSLLSISVYKYANKWITIDKGSFIDSKYPRFNIACPLGDECPSYMESALMIDPGDGISDIFSENCRISRNRSRLCMIETELFNEYGIGFLGFHALVLMCYDRWLKRPINNGTKKSESYFDMGVSALMTKTPQWEHISDGFVEVPLRNYPRFSEQARISGYQLKNRSSPCEHVRREHMRTLKNGRRVYVRPSIINKGGEKIIYRVNG